MKHVNLKVYAETGVIRKFEGLRSVVEVCEEYGVKNQTVSNIGKVKERLWKYASSYYIDASASKNYKGGACKHMKRGKDYALNVAVMKQYIWEHSSAVDV